MREWSHLPVAALCERRGREAGTLDKLSTRSAAVTDRRYTGFSLVEVLVAVALVGVIVFLAIPNIVQVKDDSETHLAIARAEALNLATAAFVQAKGKSVANSAWSGATDDPARYALAAPYLAFAPATLAGYVPGGYGMDLPNDVLTLRKLDLTKGGAAVPY